LTAHGFYRRTLVEMNCDGVIRVRRYLCHACKRTVSLWPEFALPSLRFGISVLSRFLVACLLQGQTLKASAAAARQPHMPYQRGQFWVRRFRHQAEALCLALAALISTPPAASFLSRALRRLEALGWIRSHRFLFSQWRVHLLGWPPFLAPAGRPATLPSPRSPSGSKTHSLGLAPRPLLA
jgi:hypothetical protein